MPFKDKKKNSDAKRHYQLQRDYGITLQEYKLLEVVQKNKCAICGGTPNHKNYKRAKLAVDHDHKTGKVRGLLCHSCNIRLGYLESNTSDFLLAVKNYLEKGRG
jgi:hypothetical protein